MPELEHLEIILSGDDKQIRALLLSLDKRLDKFEKDSSRKINKAGEAMEGFGTSATRAGQALAPLSAIIAGIAGYSVKIAAEYQKMGNVFRAVSDASVAQMEAVRKKAVELGQDLKLPGTSAKDAMATMVELSKAGLSVAESMAAARGSIMLAAAGQLDNARAAEIQANAMNAFALKGQEAGRVADLFSKAANASSAGVEDLAQAFAMGSASAYQAGLRIEEYTATLAAMANAGIKGSDAGTAVKSMLISLTAPSDDAAKKMREIGLSYFDAAGKARPFLDVVGDLREDLAKMTQQQQADVMRKIFGTDGVRAAQIITRLGQGFNDLVGQMDGAKGSASKVAESMNKGLLGALDALRSSVETLLLAEGEKGLPALENAIRGIAEQVSNLGKLPDPVKNLIVGVGAIALVAGPALMAIGSMSTGVAALMGSFTALTGAIGVSGAAAGAGAGAAGALGGFATVLSNPVTIAIAAGVLAVGGLAIAYNHAATEGERYTKQLDEEWKKQAEATSAKLDHIKAVGPLIEKYDALRFQVGLNNVVSGEMKALLDKIVLQAPELISSFDASGRAVDIYTDAFKRLGDEADVARQKAIDAAVASFESTAGIKRDAVMAEEARQEPIRERIEWLQSEIARLDPTGKDWGASGRREFVNGLRNELLALQRELAASIAKVNQLQAALRASLPAARQNVRRIIDGEPNPPPSGGQSGSNGGSGSSGRRAKAPSEIARTLSDDILIAVGKAVKSPGPSGMAACASFASTVLAYYTKGLTDEGGRIETSARSLVDKVIKQGGQVMEAAAARAGDLAFRKGQGPSGMHVGIVLGDGRIMDMNGQRDGKRNTMGLTSDKGWKAVGLPSGLIDRKFLLKESTSLGEAAGRAAVEAYLRPWESVVEKIKGRTQAVQAELRSMFLDERDKLALESFGKLYEKITDPGNRKAIDDLVKAQKVLTDTRRANVQFNEMAAFTGIGGFEIPTEKIIRANFNAKGDSPLGWAAREGKRIIEDINRSYDEYLQNLADEGRLLMANTEAERIRLEIVQRNRGWTESMIQTATAKTLEVESVRKWKDQVQDIVGSLTDWIQGSLDALYEDGFKGFFTQAYQGFVRMIADMAKAWIASQLQSLLYSLVGSAIKSPLKSNVGVNGGSTAGSTVTARASGGPVIAGAPYLVGERGPELLVPGAAGHVYSHADTNRIVSAITQSQNSSSTQVSQPLVVNITIQANDPAAFVASERQIEQAVAQAVRRGARR